MSVRLTEAQLWLAHTPTPVPENSAEVIAAIVAEHRAFMTALAQPKSAQQQRPADEGGTPAEYVHE